MFCEYLGGGLGAREPGMYFIEDGALPRGVTLLGRLVDPPACPKHVCYASWSSFALIFDRRSRRGTGLVSVKHARAVRAMIVVAIAELAVAPVDKAGSFIDTAERDALLECLEDLAVVGKLGSITRELDAWRDW